jgi:hypothetical protein
MAPHRKEEPLYGIVAIDGWGSEVNRVSIGTFGVPYNRLELELEVSMVLGCPSRPL